MNGLKDFFESRGKQRGAADMIRLIRDKKVDGKQVSIRGLWESLGRPKFPGQDELVGVGQVSFDIQEAGGANDSSLFPKLVGEIIASTIQESYELAQGVGMQLVTEIPAKQKDETVVGVIHDDEMIEVEEGQDYMQAGLTEKYHKIANRKFGRILGLTEEMVLRDQTGDLIRRAQNIGQSAAAKQEEIIMKAILEDSSTGAYASWRPAGTATTLYSNTSTDPYSNVTYDNIITDALADETDIDAALALLDAATDEEGRPIVVTPRSILTSPAKFSVARKSYTDTGGLGAAATTTNPHKGMFMPYSSPWVTSVLGSTYWLIGDFKRQFIYTRVFPLQTFRARPGSEKEFNADIPYQWKVRFMGGCGAISNRFVVRSTGGG